MTELLTAQAASDYLRLTLFAFDHGLIGRTHFEDRLNMLRGIANPQGGASLFAGDLLGNDAVDGEVGWADGDHAPSGDTSSHQTEGPYFDANDHTLAFKVVDGPLKGWEFHQADDDFFPSIPHGHEHGRKQPKLDVYLGWIYNNSKQVRRVDRVSIIRLWNDRAFRDFARLAISYYLDHYPRYSGWRVTDPCTLPAIRRGRRYR